MTKFEEEFEKFKLTAGASPKHKKIINHFKDWQPQQALPVVPECVAKDVKRLSLSTLADWNVAVSYISKETLKWLSTTGNTNIFLGKSWTLCSLKINGFKVEKPQLFYLKNKITESYLYYDEATKLYSDIVGNVEDFFGTKTKFTQQEIDSMQTGSYELVPVEVEE